MKQVKYLIIIVFFLFGKGTFGQSGPIIEIRKDTFSITLKNLYPLSGVSLIPQSEILQLRGRILSKRDYSISPNTLIVSLGDSLAYSIFDTLFVTYQSVKLDIKKSYRLRKIERFDALNGDSMSVLKSRSVPVSSESIFGKRMEKSGSIIRGFSVGSNKDLTLQSGFRLQLAGKLSDDIDIVAALTDENSPIQPEGNTERLDELDKVFIQVKHKNAELTFGDYEIKKSSGEFGNISRKLQGVYTEFNYDNHRGYLAYAAAKGKFNTYSFNGADAVQGPYQLFSAANSKDIIVIAGSERVYLNGMLLKRGEQNDYSIDYANAQVSFTPNKLITSASRIIVEFEYTDRFYARNFFAAGGQTSFLKDRVKISIDYFREGDDKDAPIDITLSDSDKTVLRNAGGDRTKAVKSGIALAAPDSTGRRIGVYEKVDTLINSANVTFYRYNPGVPGAVYFLTFTYVGNGIGSYNRQGPGWFIYVGTGQGNYDPVILLPLPELKQLMNINFSYNVAALGSLDINTAGSNYDLNRFSSHDNGENSGYAYNIIYKSNPFELKYAGTKLGALKVKGRERFVSNNFNTMERVGEVEFSRAYNLPASTARQNERLREAGLNYESGSVFSTDINYGHIDRQSLFQSTRIQNMASIRPISLLKFNYDIDYVASSNQISKTKWTRFSSKNVYEYKYIQPVLDVLYEDKTEKKGASDSLLASSLKYSELTPGFILTPVTGIILNLDYVRRDDYFPLKGLMQKESRSIGYSISADIRNGSELQASLNVSSRKKNYTEMFKQIGSLNSDVLLIKSLTRYNPFYQFSTDISYEASSQKSALLQRVFIPVQKGVGNYRYVGDLNNNGVKDENEYEPAAFDGEYVVVTIPSDKLYPVIDLKSGIRFKWNFNKTMDSNDLVSAALDALSFETYGRVEENSKEPEVNNIYFLKLSKFLSDENTIRGAQNFLQSVYLFENSNEFSIRWQYQQNRAQNSYGSGIEKGFKKEQSLRIKFQMVQEISNQTDLSSGTDNLFAPAAKIRNRNLDKSSLLSDFSYRPINWIEAGFSFGVSRVQDYYPINVTIVDGNSQIFRLNFSFGGYGRLRIEIERNELIVNRTDNYIPFEITNGNEIGKNFFARLNFDYRLAANLQTTANYEGRKLSESQIVHTARAELRAFF